MTDDHPGIDTGADGPPPDQQRNTGWEWDLVDPDVDYDGPWCQWGNYDSRHEALSMKVFLERYLDGDYEYEIRAHETLWRERDEPLPCGWCDHVEWYMPLVRWVFTGGDDGPFCSSECAMRWAYANDERETLERLTYRR